MGKSGRVWVKSIDLCKKQVIFSMLKMGRSIKLQIGSSWIELTHIFSHDFFFNMYLQRSKLLDVKCITLNSLLISRKSPAQQIHICSIIINYTNLNIVNQNKIAQTQRNLVYLLKIELKQTHKFHFYKISTPQNIKENYKCPIRQLIFFYWIANLIKK